MSDLQVGRKFLHEDCLDLGETVQSFHSAFAAHARLFEATIRDRIIYDAAIMAEIAGADAPGDALGPLAILREDAA